ncbi:MAG: tetraacyldisaccharide 4'-kinase, partial [Bacteroidales bacterium]|nr:tetraacyldisaccharide 4'-kinase [Bacteroidales bacterium]
IKNNFSEKQPLVFSDHHRFTKKDIQKIQDTLERSMRKNCVVITTEKDAVRLLDNELKKEIEKLPVFYLPIQIKFHRKYQEAFENQIQEYVRKNNKYS